MNRQATIDIKRLIADQFGGPMPLVEAYPLWSLDTVYKWCQRGSIKGPDLATLLGIIEHRDQKPLAIIPYLEPDECLQVTWNEKPSPTGTGPSVFD